jgi:hypothetical protein
MGVKIELNQVLTLPVFSGLAVRVSKSLINGVSLRMFFEGEDCSLLFCGLDRRLIYLSDRFTIRFP